MKCDLCQGEYREKLISRSYRHRSKTVLVEDVPALVCDRCGDILLTEETASRIHLLLEGDPDGAAPLYRFPQRSPR